MTRPTNVTGGSSIAGATGTVTAPTVSVGLADIIDVDTTARDDGDVLVWDEGTGTYVFVPPGTAVPLPFYDLVEDFGAACDNSTVDTTAWQDAMDQMAADGGGVCLVPDLSLVDDDIVMPDVDYADAEAITIAFIGKRPPAVVPSVIGSTPLNTGPGIRTSATSGAIFTGTSAGGLDNFTNVKLVLQDLIVRTPANTGGDAIDAAKIANIDFARVQVDAGNIDIASISSQSTSTSFGIKLPRVNNGATVRMRDVNVVGFYNGIRVGEHADLDGVFVWASRKPWVFEGAYHDNHIGRGGWYHCKQGIEFVAGPYTNPSFVTWEDCNIERANSGTWTQTGNDVVDASGYGNGSIRWHAVQSTVGVVHTFVNGSTDFYDLEIGEDPFGSGSSLTPASTVEDETTWGITPAVGTDLEYARQDHTHGTPDMPSSAAMPPSILLASDHATPFTFDDILQSSDGTDFLYASE